MRLSIIDQRLTNTNRYQLTNWHRLVWSDWLLFQWSIFIDCVCRDIYIYIYIYIPGLTSASPQLERPRWSKVCQDLCTRLRDTSVSHLVVSWVSVFAFHVQKLLERKDAIAAQEVCGGPPSWMYCSEVYRWPLNCSRRAGERENQGEKNRKKGRKKNERNRNTITTDYVYSRGQPPKIARVTWHVCQEGNLRAVVASRRGSPCTGKLHLSSLLTAHLRRKGFMTNERGTVAISFIAVHGLLTRKCWTGLYRWIFASSCRTHGRPTVTAVISTDL